MDTFANKYSDLVQIGSGGFATVYKATSTLLPVVAIKILHQHLMQNPDAVRRFLREARSAAALTHPNIVRIYDVDEWQGSYYIVMEYLEGESLAVKLAGVPGVSLIESAAIIEQIASALDYAHERGVVHRDIKPSNIIISPKGRATLTDFGLVSLQGAESLTQTGLVGTPEYMAPEQADARPGWKATAQTDIYALGVMAFQMLTRRLPFVADTPLGVMRAHVEQASPLVSSLLPGIEPEVDQAIARALAKKPEDRFATAGELAHILSAAGQRVNRDSERRQQLAAWYDEAAGLIREQRWVAALSLCSKILGEDPAYRDTTSLLAQAAAGAAREEKRLARWKELQGVYEKALALYGESKFDDAIAQLEGLLKRDAEFPQAAEKLAEVKAAKEQQLAERAALLTKLYDDACSDLASALGRARQLWTEQPDYADKRGLLVVLGVRADSKTAEAPLVKERARLATLFVAKSAPAARPAPPEFVPQLVTIPAGEFVMGSDETEYEKPPHRLYLAEYRIGKYPVTNWEYAAFVAERYSAPAYWPDGKYPPDRANHPVVNVSWRDAAAYCAWLSKKTGKQFRLPSEAEWEKAARGTDGRRFPWGNTFNVTACNSSEGNVGTTTTVGCYSPAGDSPFGCADMAGNVWEWCGSTWRENYETKVDARLERAGPRVVRGGSFGDQQWSARCACRVNELPDHCDHKIGFRVVQST